MQLVAYGAQDVYLTGNPQITFFKVVYRRHTNFSMETIEHPVDSAKPGGRFTITVHRNGDLATNSAFKIKVPAILAGELGGVDEIAWVRRLGHAVIKQVEIDIGGSHIDRHVGVWLDIWYELTHTTAQERGYEKLIGDVPEMTTLRSVPSVATDEVLPEYTLFIPFQFWFDRNTGLALPLIALQYHEVRFHVELETITRLLVWSGSTAPALNNFSFRSAGVMLDYIYLDSEERRRFAQVGHEYLIEQVQFPGGESIFGQATRGTTLNNKFKLNFNHPCKEIIWALKVGAFSGESVTNSFTSSNTFLAYTDDNDKWSEVVENAACGLVESLFGTAAELTAAGVPAADLVPLAAPAAANTPELQEVTLGSGLVLNITVRDETGTGVLVNLNNSGILLSDCTCSPTFDFINRLMYANVSVVYDSTAGTITRVECTDVTHSVTLRDLSIPLNSWTRSYRNVQPYQVNNKEYRVIQPCNYGLRLDGVGNPIQSGNIQLNGHNRFSTQEGAYFNYWQPRAHTRTPADGINVYCFCLNPELHQPSGTANLSRIDSTLLVLTFSDPLRTRATEAPALDWTTDSKLYIFAVNYNVLRVMSGMAGIAYSN
jgi:hypothetical protein